MTGFIRHIEHLLLHSNCVIIPELGSFITHYIPAKRIAEDTVMLPPTRIIAFNPQLRINDGNLTNSIMTTYKVSYEEAVSYVNNSVWSIKQQLREKGSFEMNGIGVLYLDINGSYKFTPSEINMPTPTLYGLECVYVRNIDTITCVQQRTGAAVPQTSHHSYSKDKYVISVNKDIANYIAAALVAIVCLFAWQRNTSEDFRSTQTASVLSVVALQSDTSPSFNAVSQEYGSTEQSEPIQQTEEKNIMSSGKYYTIVLACSVSPHNAQNFVNELNKSGINNSRIITIKGQIHVVCGSYETEEEAQAAAKELRNLSQTKDCWVKMIN